MKRWRVWTTIRVRVPHVVSGLLLLVCTVAWQMPVRAQTPRCDDADPCTHDLFIERLGCTHTPIAGCAPCTSQSDCIDPDDNLCTGTYYCDPNAGVCTFNPATVVSCDPSTGNPCTRGTCDPATGACVVEPLPNGSLCDDGDACTIQDACQAGQCEGSQSIGANGICECAQFSDCAALEDGNLCNGTLYCDLATHECKLNPATVVQCANTADTACRQNVCEPTTGQCSFQNINGSCDDGDACTIQDACQDGVCAGELSVGESGVCQCASQGDCQAYEDGDACNGTLYCDLATHECKLNPATVVTCPTVDDTSCRKNQCQPSSGTCSFENVSGLCDDGDVCTIDDVCTDGTCSGQPDVGMNATCECLSDGDCDVFDDNDLCNGTYYCDQASKTCVVNPATVMEPGVACYLDGDCPAGFGCVGAVSTTDESGGAFSRGGFCSRCPQSSSQECQYEKCEPATGECGVVLLPSTTSCSGDGDVCTIEDRCAEGACVGTPDVGPGQTCECAADTDCVDDGNVCNGVPYCDLADHTCKLNPATVVSCPTVDDTACQKNTCNTRTGACEMTSEPDGASCADDDMCTDADRCESGVCQPGVNLCACSGENACVDDGDLCNGTPYCDMSQFPFTCQTNPASVPICVDANPDDCVEPVCDPQTGSCTNVAVPDGVRCNDDDSCTEFDRCTAGACGGTPLCGPHGTCVPDLSGSTFCQCAPGYVGARCNELASTSGCGDVGVEPECSENHLLVCTHADPTVSGPRLIDTDCAALPAGGAEVVSGVCQSDVPGLGASCVVTHGDSCSRNDAVDPWPCGDGQAFVAASGCDLLRGCIADLGACDPAQFTSTCLGSLRVSSCTPSGQKVVVDCTSPELGGSACEGAGVCTGVAEGSPCLVGTVECAAGLICDTTGQAAGLGFCAAVDPDPYPTCAAPASWLGDGYCDAVANTADCGYDDGDCCLSTCENATYACGYAGFDCQDPSVPGGDGGTPDGGVGASCPVTPAWLGDGYCDESANVAECGYDQGDCCATTCVSAAYLCGMVGYDCVDPDAGAPSDGGSGDAGSGCSAPREWRGDGYCDETANNATCGFDLGDCCPDTCNSAAYTCGAGGYDCRDPSVGVTGDAGVMADAGGAVDAGTSRDAGGHWDGGRDAGLEADGGMTLHPGVGHDGGPAGQPDSGPPPRPEPDAGGGEGSTSDGGPRPNEPAPKPDDVPSTCACLVSPPRGVSPGMAVLCGLAALMLRRRRR